MSLHAQLSPEAEARLEAQRRSSVITSIMIALLVISLVVLVLLFILMPNLMIKSPTIVAYQAGAPQEDTMDQKELNPQIQRKPSAPSSSMAKVIASTTPSPTAVPVPERRRSPISILAVVTTLVKDGAMAVMVVEVDLVIFPQ